MSRPYLYYHLNQVAKPTPWSTHGQVKPHICFQITHRAQELGPILLRLLKRHRKKKNKNPLQISINYPRGGTCISLTVVYANRIRGINILEGADICPDILNP